MISILVSGFGLGFYIPGLLLRNRIEILGQAADAEVFESLFRPAALDIVEASRNAYRKDFKLAIKAQKVPFDVRSNIDPLKLEAMLANWEREKREIFIVLSGHWVHVLDAYRQRTGLPIDVTLLHLDASLAPSWLQTRRIKPDYAKSYHETWLYRTDPPSVLRTTSASIASIAWPDRENDLVVHGGGWGLGTFEQAVEGVEQSGYRIIQATYGFRPPIGSPPRIYVADDPSWRVWHKDDDGRLVFPPFGFVESGGWKKHPVDDGCHGLLQLIVQARAIISKPGAGTLIDCLTSSTPLIMLAPFGSHEEANAQLWSKLGFGIKLDEWKVSGYSQRILEYIHNNIRRYIHNVPDLATEIVTQMHR